jgi:carboxyl-terminal processing protease
MEEKKKTNLKFIIFLLLAFLIGFIFGRIYLPEREISLANLFTKIQFKDEKIDYTLFQDVLETIRTKYFKQPVSEKDLFYGAIEGLVSGLKDPYTVFFKPEMAEKFKSELSGTFEGIGAEIDSKKGRIVIVAPLENTPAFRAGLKPGDEIYAIDGEDTLGMNLEEAVSKIRGKKGTQVKLLIMRKGWEKPKEFVITRDVIVIKTVKWEMKGDLAYLKISYFNDRTLNEFDKAVREILLKSPKGIILDLRNNPGGYLYAAVEIAGNWIGENVVVIEKGRGGIESEHRSRRREKFSNLKTVVLVNHGSASGSEILAGALQDYKVAKIVGEKTFGKGSVQEVIEFKDGSMIKITVAQWLTPKRREIQDKGIEPDVTVEMTEKDYEEGKDPQLEKAIEILNL